MRRISSPPRGCRPRYFPLSVGRRAGSYFRLETIFHFHSSLSLSVPPHLRPLLASSIQGFRFSFSLSSLSPVRGKSLPPRRASLCARPSNRRQNKYRGGREEGERGSVIDALFHLRPSTDSYLRIWILGRKNRVVYRRARRKERFAERSFPPHPLVWRNTRHPCLSRVSSFFFLSFLFFFFFVSREINPLSRLFVDFSRKYRRNFFFWFKEEECFVVEIFV